MSDEPSDLPRPEVNELDIGGGASSTVLQDQGVELWPGDYINEADITSITSADPTRVIVLAGLKDSGKTTIIASIYEQYQLGPFAGQEFAGSRTLLGLEKLCHQSRVESERNDEDTERTSRSHGYEMRFAHIRVRDIEHRYPSQSVLISDISGEVFRDARDSADDARRLTILRRADRIVFLVDGEKLTDKRERHSAYEDALVLLQRFLDARLIGGTSRIILACTKADLLTAAMETDLRAYLEQKALYVAEHYGRFVAELAVSYIAARPREGGYLAATGIREAWQQWTAREVTTKQNHYDENWQLWGATPVDPLIDMGQTVPARSIVMIGPRDTGKTTFLVALEYQLRALKVTASGLQFRALPDRMDRLKQMEERWLRCEALDHTSLATESSMIVARVANATGDTFELVIPNLSGEGFREQWTERHAQGAYTELIRVAAGIVLFIHPEGIKEPTWIAQARDLAIAGGDVRKLESRSTAAEASDQAYPAVSESQEAIGSADGGGRDWNPYLIPTQVQLVELLQIADELAQDKVLPLSVVVSAWDLIESQGIAPRDFLSDRTPLLTQFLDASAESRPIHYFGVSAIGGDPAVELERLASAPKPELRPFTVTERGRSSDLSEVIAWQLT